MADTCAQPLAALLRIFLPTRVRPSASAHRYDIPDEELFARVCGKDDHAAFGELITRYRTRLTALVRRMLTPAQTGVDPDDVAQEAFIEAYHKRHTFRAGKALRPWLYSIAVNRCLNHLRSARQESLVVLDDDAPLPRSGDDPESILMRRLDAAELEQAAALLPPRMRAVLLLRYLDDMTYEEIADTCHSPVGTVKTQLFRARAELKRRLENRDQTL